MRRFTFNKDTGANTYPPDAITGSITGKKWISVVQTAAGFLICCLNQASIVTPYVYQYLNTSPLFTDDAWSSSSPGAISVFPTSSQPMSLSVKKLSTGDLAMVGAYRTSLDGTVGVESGGIGISNLPNAMLRCGVGVYFSSDGGFTWVANPTPDLTSYAGTPQFDLSGILSAASADLQELSNNEIVVAYQEHTAPQLINNGTTLKIPKAPG
jgi:hypothetical protein